MKLVFIYSFKRILKLYFKYNLKRFNKFAKSPEVYQSKIFDKILLYYAQTTFGQDYKIRPDINYTEFKSLVPIMDYEKLSVYLEKEKLGLKNSILIKDAIIWERTSGSSGRSKDIPYTKDGLKLFRDMLIYWISDLGLNGPSFKTFKTFLSVSPPFFDEEQNLSKSNHSFEDDTDYLSPVLKFLFGKYLLLPKGLKKVQHPEDFKIILCSFLIASKDLEIFFIWSPSYLLQLLDFMTLNKDKIINTIQASQYNYRHLVFKIPFRNKEELELYWGKWNQIWPDLKFISCWMDGSAELFISKLKLHFPNVIFQAKGLLATESPMTFPLYNSNSPVPLVHSIFYEFIDEKNEVYRLHELQINKKYEIVISHLSGIIRYRIGDIVEVVGHYHNLPCLKFLGRNTNVCDLTGEKLNEIYVQSSLKQILKKDECAFLVPAAFETTYYLCFYDGNDPDFGDKLEAQLMLAFHYMQSRNLGQLEKIKVLPILSAEKLYYNFYLKKGLTLGDIKFSTLIKDIQVAKELIRFANE